jgi:phospholipase C
MLRRFAAFLTLCAAALAVLALSGGSALAGGGKSNGDEQKLQQIEHIVVIYEENHSFDNLYGGWEGVNGLADADTAHTLQVAQTGPSTFTTPFQCLYMDDVNLQAQSAANPAAPLTATCPSSTTQDTTTPGSPFPSHFTNAPFTIDDYLSPSDHTCPKALQAFSFPNGVSKNAKNPDGSYVGLPGGCTRDIVHRFYEEQFQLNGGQQNRYVLGSDAAGLVMGTYNTQALPIYQYLHAKHHPHYAILDNFFQAAFGGSFLNHQFLIAAAPPTCTPSAGPPVVTCPAHAVLDGNGFTTAGSPPASNRPPGMGALYTSPGNPAGTPLNNGAITQACGLPSTIAGLACGDAVVNTTQPAFQPSGAFGAKIPAQTNPTIGDSMSGGGVDWAWYSGGWSNADGDVGGPGWTNGTAPNPATSTHCYDPDADPAVASWPRCPNNLFQYHHQPFNYYANFSTGTPQGLANRAAHLKDEQEFIQLAQGSTNDCNLKPVSFIKPIGQENEHPGYASESGGSSHLVSLLQDIENSSCAKNTMVIVTYDEFGGQWDHVSPPGQGNNNGPHDQWGPGTRIPALVISPHLKGHFVVDNSEYDTTSILATIEQRYGLDPLGLTTRDGQVNSLSNVFDAHKPQVIGGD